MKKGIPLSFVSVVLSLALTMMVFTLLIIVSGSSPADVYLLMYEDVLTSGYGIGQTLFRATPYIFTACGIAICFHASLFNIGAEGQLNAGSFVMGISAVSLSGLPLILNILISTAAGFAASAVCGLVPAMIKVRKGVSEVITTIMMNFVILAFINYLMVDFFAVKSTLRTVSIGDNNLLPKFSDYVPFFEGSSLNLAFIAALITAVAIYILIYKTTFGYKIRAVGFNPVASKYIGIRVNRITVLAFVAGAGVTCLAGLNFIFGYKSYYELGFSNNIGFAAIAVSLLARNNPIGIIFSSLLFAALDYGGLAINNLIPKEVMLLAQGLVILSILASDSIVRKLFGGRAYS